MNNFLVDLHPDRQEHIRADNVLLPNMESIVSLVVDTLDSPGSRRVYRTNLEQFLSWYTDQGHPQLSVAVVERYKSHLRGSSLSSSAINLKLTTVRRLAQALTDNALLPEALLAGINRMKGVRASSRRLGNWLSKQQAEMLISLPNARTLKGIRDRAILTVMIGCGLRREEAAKLTIEHIQKREGRWVIVDLVGKGRKMRSVPMPAWTKAAVDTWTTAAGISAGSVFRSLRKGDHLEGTSMSAQAIRDVIHGYGKRLGVDLAPHDLRRTYAQLARKAGCPLEQIQLGLGHASIVTTERYLGLKQDLSRGPGDYIGIEI